MSPKLEELAMYLLELPADDRAELAERLIASLDEGEDEDPRIIEKLWIAEAHRRLKEVELGAPTVDADQALA